MAILDQEFEPELYSGCVSGWNIMEYLGIILGCGSLEEDKTIGM